MTVFMHPNNYPDPGRIQKVDPLKGSEIYTIRVLESRIGGSAFWILPGVWVEEEDEEKEDCWISGV